MLNWVLVLATLMALNNLDGEKMIFCNKGQLCLMLCDCHLLPSILYMDSMVNQISDSCGYHGFE